jgi:hypothetical protein
MIKKLLKKIIRWGKKELKEEIREVIDKELPPVGKDGIPPRN